MARILLTDSDPAVQELLRGFGHEPVVLDRARDLAAQVRRADVVLPDPDSPIGRRVARIARAIRARDQPD